MRLTDSFCGTVPAIREGATIVQVQTNDPAVPMPPFYIAPVFCLSILFVLPGILALVRYQKCSIGKQLGCVLVSLLFGWIGFLIMIRFIDRNPARISRG